MIKVTITPIKQKIIEYETNGEVDDVLLDLTMLGCVRYKDIKSILIEQVGDTYDKV